MEDTPVKLSFLIPALNESNNIGSCIEAIKEHTPASLSYEILVGDHASTDDTAKIAKRYGAAVHYATSISTVGVVRNMLADGSKGVILVFLDADVWLTEQWGAEIESVVEILTRLPGQVTGSLCETPVSASMIDTCWFDCIKRGRASHINGGHLIVPRETFYRIGGFSNNLETGEDFEFCQRAIAKGVALRERPSLIAIHAGYPSTVKAFAKREIWHGKGDFHSMDAFRQSKVAMLGLAYLILLVLGVIIALPVVSDPSSGFFFATFTIPIAVSFIKFERLNSVQRLVNILLCAVYLLSRGLSVFPFLGKAPATKARTPRC